MATLIFTHEAAKTQVESTLGNALDNVHEMGRYEGDEYAQDMGFSDRAALTAAIEAQLIAFRHAGMFTMTDDMAIWLLESMEAEAPLFDDEYGPDGMAAIEREIAENFTRNQLSRTPPE